MNLRLIALVILLLLGGVFAALNWAAFTAIDELNLLFTSFEAPLGLLLLGFIGVLVVVFLLYAGSLRTSALVEARRYSKELEAAQKVANEVEESRINALQETVTTEMTELRETMSTEAESTRAQIDESRNVLTAHLAQIDDFIKSETGGKAGDGPGTGSGASSRAASATASGDTFGDTFGDDAADDASAAAKDGGGDR